MFLFLFFASVDSYAENVQKDSYRFFEPINPSEFLAAIFICFEAVIRMFPKLKRFSFINKLRILNDVINKHDTSISDKHKK